MSSDPSVREPTEGGNPSVRRTLGSTTRPRRREVYPRGRPRVSWSRKTNPTPVSSLIRSILDLRMNPRLRRTLFTVQQVRETRSQRGKRFPCVSNTNGQSYWHATFTLSHACTRIMVWSCTTHDSLHREVLLYISDRTGTLLVGSDTFPEQWYEGQKLSRNESVKEQDGCEVRLPTVRVITRLWRTSEPNKKRGNRRLFVFWPKSMSHLYRLLLRVIFPNLSVINENEINIGEET